MAENHRKLINHPDRLIEDLVEGMILAHPDLLCIEGDTGRAIVARSGPRDGKVGIVVGGGSGHEPAFAGYVGKGLADAPHRWAISLPHPHRRRSWTPGSPPMAVRASCFSTATTPET